MRVVLHSQVPLLLTTSTLVLLLRHDAPLLMQGSPLCYHYSGDGLEAHDCSVSYLDMGGGGQMTRP
jgi:hypothetical protein